MCIRDRTYVEFKARELVVDVDSLLKSLAERGVTIPDRQTLEFLVEFAREEGLDIPYREAEKSVRLVKGEVSIEDIRGIYSASLQPPSKSTEENVVIILLKTPREATYRGVKEEEVPKSPVGSDVLGKLVLSLSKGIMGYVGDLVIGPGEVGIRAYKKRGVEGYVNWLAFVSSIRKLGYESLYHRLVEYRNPYRESRLPLKELEKLKEFLRSEEAPCEVLNLLEEHVVLKRVGGVFVDIPWSAVKKLGDVIIVE